MYFFPGDTLITNSSTTTATNNYAYVGNNTVGTTTNMPYGDPYLGNTTVGNPNNTTVTTDTVNIQTCSMCGQYGHKLLSCSQVESIEYYENGNIKKITKRKPNSWYPTYPNYPQYEIQPVITGPNYATAPECIWKPVEGKDYFKCEQHQYYNLHGTGECIGAKKLA